MTEQEKIPEELHSEAVVEVKQKKCSWAKLWCKIVLGILIILILCLIAVSIFNYKMIEELRHMTMSSATITQQLKTQISTLDTNFAQESLKLKQIKQQISQMSGSSDGLIRHWTLLEVQYLAQLANFNLQFQGDISSSLELLEMADKRINDLSDDSLLPVRKSLANDITALQGFATTDLAGILLKLTGLSQSVAQLPTVTAHTLIAREQTVSQPEQSPQVMSKWRQELNEVWQNLKSLIVIRHHSETVDPLLIAADQTYLSQHLQLLLAEARWAVLHQQPGVFSKSIEQSIAWVSQYYDQKSPMTQNFLQQLTSLAKVTLKPNVPEMNTTLAVIKSALATTPSSSNMSNKP